MKKIIAAINMTIDGVYDHTAGLPDEEIHQHYADLFSGVGVSFLMTPNYSPHSRRWVLSPTAQI